MSSFPKLAPACVLVLLGACSRETNEVIVYVAHDRVLSEPILQRFEKETGVAVRAVYDVETNKTLGLTNRLLAEASAPRADLFWNNEIVQTLRLQSRGVAAMTPMEAPPLNPHSIVDDEKRWVGFAARARVALVNTQQAGDSAPEALGLWDLTDPQWQGRVTIADPHFGTTGTHFSALLTAWGEPEFRRWLRALRANDVVIVAGNARARDAVVAGTSTICLTDTDDAAGALAQKAPVRVLFPDQGAGQGTLLIPNSVSLVTGGPHPQLAAQLATFLLSAEVEAELAKGRGAQLPINHDVPPPREFPPLADVRAMPADFARIAENFEPMLRIVEQEWFPERGSP